MQPSLTGSLVCMFTAFQTQPYVPSPICFVTLYLCTKPVSSCLILQHHCLHAPVRDSCTCSCRKLQNSGVARVAVHTAVIDTGRSVPAITALTRPAYRIRSVLTRLSDMEHKFYTTNLTTSSNVQSLCLEVTTSKVCREVLCCQRESSQYLRMHKIKARV